MKKIVCCSLAILLLFSGCSVDSEDVCLCLIYSFEDSKGGYKSELAEIYKYDHEGNQISRVIYDMNENGNESDRWWYEYNENGDIIADGNYDSGSKCEYEYDEYGNQNKCIEYSNGEISGWQENQFDIDNNMTRKVYYDSDGTQGISYKYEYNEKGNLVKSLYYYSDGIYGGCDEYIYNDAEELIKWVDCNSKGDVVSWEEYYYDDDGNMIECVGNSSNGYNWKKEYIYADLNRILNSKESVEREIWNTFPLLYGKDIY